MIKTIDLLFDNILNGYLSILDSSVIHDYFGYQNNDENNEIIYGIYENLIVIKGISKKIIENCYLTNRLDELIYKKHIYNKTVYYNLFITKNIIIGNTFLYDNKIDLLPIYNDNHCPSCNTYDYINSLKYDCSKCLSFICQSCVFNDCCHKCENPNLEQSIKNKLAKFPAITYDDIKELLRKQKFKCYICNDMILSYQWLPKCLYQFEIQQINLTLPPIRNNVLITCHYCSNETKKSNMKICENKCHNDNKIIISNKNNISSDKIKSLLLL
jgi:hypothetical protein